MGKIYKLGEICEIRSGKTPEFENEKYWCRHSLKNCFCIPWYQGRDIVNQALKPEKYITPLAVKENNQPLTTSYSLLFFALECLPFFSGETNISCYGGGPGISILEPNPNLVVSEYLYYSILSKREKLKGLRSGSVQKFLPKSELKRVSISLPPLSEQNQILQKFQIVYNKLFQSEIIYNDFLLKMIQKYLELGDLLFQKYKDSQIRIKDHFKLVRGKTPPTNNPEYYQNGTIKWMNSGVLTNLYFLTEETPASKLITEKAVKECQIPFAQPNTVLFSDIDLNPSKIVWVCQDPIGGTHVWTLLGTHVWTLLGTDVYQNSTLFFALRQIDFSVYASGSIINHLQGSVLLNMKINWVSNPAHQKKLFAILNSKLAEIKDLHSQIKDLHSQIKDLHSQIKDLHSQIKDLLLLKYFGKK